MPHHHTRPSPGSGKSVRSMIWTLLSTFTILSELADASSFVGAQFGLDPNRGDISACWLKCHKAVIPSIPCPWSEHNVNDLYYIDKNCEYDVYLKTMAACLPVYREDSWDVGYAVEYGRDVCKKAGRPNGVIPLSEEYLANAGGFFNTSAAAELMSISSASRAAHQPAELMLKSITLIGLLYVLSRCIA